MERERAGYLNPRRLVHAQQSLAITHGGRLLRGAVHSIRKDNTTGLWHLQGRGADGTFELCAEKVLLATGSLINHTGALPAGQQLALHAFTEPNLLAEVPADQLDHLRDLPTIVTIDPEDTGNDNTSLYLLPPIRYPDGRWYLRIGPAMQPIFHELHGPDQMQTWYAQQRITQQQSGFLQRMLRLLVPNLEPVSVREACCVVDKTPTRYPYIGHVSEDTTLTVVTGGNGHGARGCDEIGQLISSVVLDKPWDFPLPRDIFAPIAQHTPPADGRPSYLTPPFGLC
ncbi:FAD-binding oxidoreductase [Streptomyces sp. TLI_146]|uniref:NAD(P)/FAD-dependent oxidoreductase n=1 Tax=Streptomyces sp. TLI_146 TaxID=1938858 RepID=UPI000C713F42|nr:FAD-binding oxidoreductase [Streptomyces sp. TLI_146]PKV90166.1 FAD dependent oxidoreductase [Streptomyces sp. TLI_146]